MSRFIFLCLVSLILSCSPPQAESEIDYDGASKGILEVFGKLETDWNNGDMKSYMEGFLNDPGFSYVTNDEIVYGWQMAFGKYLYQYPTPESMGRIRMITEQLEIISDAMAFQIGQQFFLDDDKTIISSGFFTFQWKKVGDQWFIARNHTCQ